MGIRSAQACVRPMFEAPARVCEVMPVFSSGQTAEQVFDTYKTLGSTDLIYCCCGGGIMAHPGGVPGGVQSLGEAWEAAVQGVDLETHALTHPALAQAIAAFRAKP